eukprot:13800743-Heterocapsa_arctica.AAC.1
MTFQYFEKVVASSAVIVEEWGEMMYEKQYLNFAETFEGGKLTEAQAMQQWTTWRTRAEEPDSTWPPVDQKGPPASPMHIW